MNFKKNLIFLSALALCGSAAFSGFGNGFFNISSSVSVSADENEITDSGKCGENIEWAYYEKTSTLILSGTGDMYNYGGLNVTGIDGDEPDYYKYADNIKNIIINEGITSIGSGAFTGKMGGPECYVIESISIPDSVKTIGDSAFCQSEDIGKVLEALGDTKVENIGEYAFHWSGGSCEKCVIPETVKSIGEGAFGYTYIKSVVIPKNLSYENIENAGFGYYMDNISGTYYGYKGSDAEKFVNDMNAKDPSETSREINLKFIALDSEPETPPETTEPEIPSETAAWKEAYIEILNTEKSSDLWYSDGFKFDLYDIDSDGIPELFISKGPAVYNGVDIYTFDGENAIKLVNDLYMMGIVGVSKKNNMVESGLYNHGYDGHSYWTKNGNSLDSLCYFNFDEGATETRHWFVNGEEVSVKEYCDSINKYYSDDWVSVGRTYEYSDAESAMNRYIENGYNVDLPNSSDYAKYEFPSKEYIKDMYEYAGVDPSEPEKTQKSWQTAYADFISGKSGKFSLAYIDDDDIPELIHASADRGSGISIYKYSDGEVKSADNCGFADTSTDKAVSYLEKGNSLCITDAKTNGKYYYFYTIENDELKENGNISFDYLNNDFSVNGNSATEDECNAKADEYKVSDMKSIDRENMYDISSENIEKYLSAENNDDGNTDDTDENTNNNNNTNNTNNKNTANNSGKSAADNKTSAPPDTGDKGTGIALCIAASAAVAAWITRKKD